MLSTLLKFILLLNLGCSLSQSTAKSYGLFQFKLREGNKSYDSCSAVDPAHNYSIIIEKAKKAEINNEDVEFMTMSNLSNFTLQWSIINNRSTNNLSNSWSCLKKTSLQAVYLKFLNEFVILGQRRNIFHNLKKVPDAQMLGLIQQSWINWTYFEEAFNYISKAQNYTLNPYDIITTQGWPEFHDLIQNQDISKAAWFDNYMVRKNSTDHDLDQLDILQFWQIFIIYIYDPKEKLLQNFDWMKTWSPNMWGFYRSQSQQIQIDQARIIKLIDTNKTYLELDNLTQSNGSIILQVTGFDENNTYYHGFKDLSFTPQDYEDDLRSFINPKKNMILRSNLVFSGKNISVTYNFVDTICREQTKPLGIRFSLSYANQKRDIEWDNLQYFDANISQSEEDECVVEQELYNNGQTQLDGVRDLIDYSSLNLLIGKFRGDQINYMPEDKSRNRTRLLIEERKNHSFDIRIISQYEGIMLDEISHEWETQLPSQFDEGHISGQSFLFHNFQGQVVFQAPNITSSALLVIQTDMIFPNKYVRTCWDYVYVIGAEEQSVYPSTDCDSESNWTQIFKCINIISQLSMTSTSSLNIDCNEWSCSTHGLCTQDHPYIRCNCYEGFKGLRCNLDERIFDQRMKFILFALNKALNEDEDDLTPIDDLLEMVFKIINLVDYQSDITIKKIVQLMTSLIDKMNTHQRFGRSMVICQQIQDYIISSKSDVLVIGRPLFVYLQGLRLSLLNQVLSLGLAYVEVSNQNSIIRIEQIDKNTTEKYLNFTTNGSLFSFGKKLKSPVVQIMTDNIPQGAVYVSILLLNAHNYGIVDDEIDSGLFDMNFHLRDGQLIQPTIDQQYEVLITIPMLKTIRSPQNIACFHLDGHSLSSDLIDILMYDITKQYVICKSKTIKKTVIAQRKKNSILDNSQNSSWIDALNFAPIILPYIIMLSILLLS